MKDVVVDVVSPPVAAPPAQRARLGVSSNYPLEGVPVGRRRRGLHPQRDVPLVLLPQRVPDATGTAAASSRSSRMTLRLDSDMATFKEEHTDLHYRVRRHGDFVLRRGNNKTGRGTVSVALVQLFTFRHT